MSFDSGVRRVHGAQDVAIWRTQTIDRKTLIDSHCSFHALYSSEASERSFCAESWRLHCWTEASRVLTSECSRLRFCTHWSFSTETLIFPAGDQSSYSDGIVNYSQSALGGHSTEPQQLHQLGSLFSTHRRFDFVRHPDCLTNSWDYPSSHFHWSTVIIIDSTRLYSIGAHFIQFNFG